MQKCILKLHLEIMFPLNAWLASMSYIDSAVNLNLSRFKNNKHEG